MVALDSLVDERPHTLRTVLRRSAQLAEEPHGRQTHRPALLVEQRGFGSGNRFVARAGIVVDHRGEDIEALPARLGFGAIQRVDDGSAERDHQIGMILGKEGERRCCVLALAPRRTRQRTHQLLELAFVSECLFGDVPGSLCLFAHRSLLVLMWENV